MARRKNTQIKSDINPSLDTIYRQGDGVISRQNADGTIFIMRMSDFEHYYQVDAMAAEFWKRIDGQNSLRAICEELCMQSKLKKNFIEQEIATLKKNLLSASLIIEADQRR